MWNIRQRIQFPACLFLIKLFRTVMIPKSSDLFLQRRTFSTKIKVTIRSCKEPHVFSLNMFLGDMERKKNIISEGGGKYIPLVQLISFTASDYLLKMILRRSPIGRIFLALSKVRTVLTNTFGG